MPLFLFLLMQFVSLAVIIVVGLLEQHNYYGRSVNLSMSSAPSEWSCCTESGSCRHELPLWHRGRTVRSRAGCRRASSGNPRSRRFPHRASQCSLTKKERRHWTWGQREFFMTMSFSENHMEIYNKTWKNCILCIKKHYDLVWYK